MLLVGTSRHLEDLDREYTIAEEVSVEGIAVAGGFVGAPHVLLDGERLGRVDEFEVAPVGLLPSAGGQSLAGSDGFLLVGTEGAHLLSFDIAAASFSAVGSFDSVEGRDSWENPANATPDTRSVAVTASGAWLVGVHVGGLWRSGDRGQSWANVVPPDDDIHEVFAGAGAGAAAGAGTVVVAAARGFGWSPDDGLTWEWTTDGLHSSYCRAVGLDGDVAFFTASTGPGTRDGRLYRCEIGGTPEPVTGGLPASFPFNLDTGCVAVRGSEVAFGTPDGRVFRSSDGGSHFELAAERMHAVRILRFV
jgi:hypothetical protein